MEHEPQTQFTNMEELKKMVLQGNINGSRLPPLRLPRDLTLGGTKTKKVFTPNLNVVRNKDRSKRPTEITRAEKRPKLPRNNAKHHKKKSNILQSDGVFAQGMGEGKYLGSDRTSVYNERNTNGANTALLSMPTINKCWENINKNEEKMLLERLMNDSDCGSESDSDDYAPISLPLEFINNIKQTKEWKSQTVYNTIKQELPDDTDKIRMKDVTTVLDVKPIVKSENQGLHETQFASSFYTSKLYNDANLGFSFIKLPSSFPGKVFKDTADEKDSDILLSNLKDGPIGKLLVRKSGRMELIIKNTEYKFTSESVGNVINSAVLFPGKQSIAIEPSLVTLGTIEQTVSLSPNWDSLFERAKKNPKFYY